MTIFMTIMALVALGFAVAFLRHRELAIQTIKALAAKGILDDRTLNAQQQVIRKLGREVVEYRNVNAMFQADLDYELKVSEANDQALMYAEDERLYEKAQSLAAHQMVWKLQDELNELKVAKMDDDRMFQMLTGRLEDATTRLRILEEAGATVTIVTNVETEEQAFDVRIKAPEGYEITPIEEPKATAIFSPSDIEEAPEPTPDQRVIELLEQIAYNTTEPAYGYEAAPDFSDPEEFRAVADAMMTDEAPELYPDPISEDRLAQLRADGLIH